MIASCVPILANLGHIIVNWDTKNIKNPKFLTWKVIKLLIIPKQFDVQTWNLYTMCVLMNALCKPSLGAPSCVIKIVQPKSGQKVDNFKLIYLNNFRYWWKIVCDFWAHYQLSFFWLRSFTPTWYYFFSFFLLFFFFIIIILRQSTFKPLNALHLKFERLKISGRTSARMKLGVPGWGISLKSALQSFELLNRWS